jgi:outer membrane protein assembly factor BamB
VKLSDGSPLYKSKDKPGILRGAYDGRAFFRDGDKVTAFSGGDGAETWTFDAKSNGAYVYTLDDLEEMDQGAPEDMHDILISNADNAFRVSTATGKATWTIKRGGMSWWTSKHAFLTESGDKVTGYDWNTGAKLWEVKIGSKPKPKDAGDYIVFIDGDKWQGTNPLPPFQFSAANGKTGKIAWTKKEVDGKKIVDWSLLGTDRIRLENEKGTLAVLNVADGSAATPPAEAADRFFVNYVEKEKALQCRDYTGKLLWERKGEPNLSEVKFLTGHDCIVWVSKDGTEEVINRADGATLWKMKGAKIPSVAVNTAGTYMVAQNDKDLTIVKLAP